MEDQIRYKALRNTISTRAKEAMERHLLGIWEEVEECTKKTNFETGYKTIKIYFIHKLQVFKNIIRGENYESFSIKTNSQEM